MRFSPPRRPRPDNTPSHHRNDNTPSRPRPQHNDNNEQQQAAPADTPSHPTQLAHLDKAKPGPVNLTGPFPVKSSLAEPARSPAGHIHPLNETPPTVPHRSLAQALALAASSRSSASAFKWQSKHNASKGAAVVAANPNAASAATSTAGATRAASHNTPAWQPPQPQPQPQQSDRQWATHPSRRGLVRGVGSRSLDNGLDADHVDAPQGGGESSHRYEEEDEVRIMNDDVPSTHPTPIPAPSYSPLIHLLTNLFMT